MKKLNKFQINSEKMIRIEELVLLRGGYTQDPCSGNLCETKDDCCPSNPDCIYVPIANSGVCCSPGGGD